MTRGSHDVSIGKYCSGAHSWLHAQCCYLQAVCPLAGPSCSLLWSGNNDNPRFFRPSHRQGNGWGDTAWNRAWPWLGSTPQPRQPPKGHSVERHSAWMLGARAVAKGCPRAPLTTALCLGRVQFPTPIPRKWLDKKWGNLSLFWTIHVRMQTGNTYSMLDIKKLLK